MKKIYILSAFVCLVKVVFADYESKIAKYFKSETTATIRRYFQTHKQPLESAIALILKENYGDRGMNVYIRRQLNSRTIASAFYFTDNIVDVLLLGMNLLELPNMIEPRVNFPLAFDNLQIEAGLGQIRINTKYIVSRNTTSVEQSLHQDPYRMSPFSFDQVQETGDVTIIADDCTLLGYTITSLGGDTVNLGHDTFKVTNCSFSIEISSPGFDSPPVIAPYFSKEQRKTLERLVTKPIRAELMPKLQAAVFSYVNTSAIFRDKLYKLRSYQNMFYKETSSYMSLIVRTFVKDIMKKTEGILELEPIQISWNNSRGGSFVQMMNMKLYGLDTAYVSHAGGPFKSKSIGVAETIRFSTMQVRGHINFENVTVQHGLDFAVEFKDVAFNVEMEAKDTNTNLVLSKLDFVGWRKVECSIIELFTLVQERRTAQSFITGYLETEIPKRLLQEISEILKVIPDEPDSQKKDNKQSSEESDREKPQSEKESHEDKKDRDTNKSNINRSESSSDEKVNIEKKIKHDEDEFILY